MAKWRKVHINSEEWNWTQSKNRPAIVIRDPNRKYYTVSFSEFNDCLLPEDLGITPGIVKQYIERNLLK